MIPATVVVVTYNRLEKTRQCIESLLGTRSTYPYKLYVIDNGSKDGTRDYLIKSSRFFEQLILLERNIGTAKAQNIGWALSDKNYYVKLDDDVVILREDWLDTLVGIVNMLPQYAVSGHIWFEGYGTKVIDGFYLRDIDGGLDYYSPCTLIPKRTFDVLGYWTTAFGVYGFEDFDYRVRMSIAGLRYCYAGDTNYIKHLGPNMDPNDGEELVEIKMKSRMEGEIIRKQLVGEYEAGVRSIKSMEIL